MSGIRVCYVAKETINNALEGHNIASIRIMQAAVKAGISAEIVSLENTSSCSRRNLHPIKSILSKDGKTSVFPSMWETFSSFPAMLTAKNLNCDIIHLLNVTKEMFLLTNKLIRTSSPCVTHLYHSDLAFSTQPTFKIRSLLIRLGIFNHILSSNQRLVHYLIRELKVDRSKVHFVPYPVDVNRFRPLNRQKLREKYHVPTSAPVIAYVGAADSDRGFFFLLKAFKEILHEIPETILYICHPDRKMKSLYDALSCARLNQRLGNNIMIHGPNPAIEETYSLADVIVLPFQKPYWITAPPLVLIEAMASATPIVTTPLDVTKEIGTNMIDMIFTSPNDLNSFTNAVVYALGSQDEARKIGFRARENATKNFSMEVVGRKLKETYREICN